MTSLLILAHIGLGVLHFPPNLWPPWISNCLFSNEKVQFKPSNIFFIIYFNPLCLRSPGGDERLPLTLFQDDAQKSDPFRNIDYRLVEKQGTNCPKAANCCFLGYIYTKYHILYYIYIYFFIGASTKKSWVSHKFSGMGCFKIF